MAIGAYTKTTWANSPSTSSPLSAANLQHIEDQVKDITDAAVSGGASPTKIWTSTNDGNGGQPPAPKPRAATDSDGGQWTKKFTGSGLGLAAPEGGTWAYFAFQYDQSTGGIYNDNAGVVAGGTVVLSAVANKIQTGFFYKVV